MRPKRLVMQAFASYCQREVIDFDELGNCQLFLICGATGAGKTSIFDGISFALFGEASGQFRDTGGLRSDFAPANLLTEVRLSFGLRGRQYTVHRIPRQMRQKERGEGVTEQKAEATLYFDDQDYLPVTGLTNVNQRLSQLIGLRADQFKQMMMLPQGEFRKLLVVDSKERESILRGLFDVAIYREFQERLNRQAKELLAEVRQTQAFLKTSLLKLSFLTERPELEKQINEDRLALDRLEREIEQQINLDKIAIRELEECLIKQNEEIEATVRQIERAERRNQELAHLVELKQTLTERRRQQAQFDQKKIRIEEAERAERLTPAYEQLVINRERQRANRQRLIAEQATFDRNEPAYQRLVLDYQRLIAPDSQQAFEEAKEDLRQRRTAIESAGKLYQLKKQINEQKQRVLKAVYQRLQGSLQNYQQLTDDLMAKQIDSQKLKKKQAQLTEEVNRLKAQGKQLDQIIMNHQVFSFQQMLTEGHPCPVCGQVYHDNYLVERVSSSQLADQEDLVAKQYACQQQLQTKQLALAKIEERQQWLEQSVNEAAAISEGKKEQLLEELTNLAIPDRPPVITERWLETLATLPLVTTKQSMIELEQQLTNCQAMLDKRFYQVDGQTNHQAEEKLIQLTASYQSRLQDMAYQQLADKDELVDFRRQYEKDRVALLAKKQQTEKCLADYEEQRRHRFERTTIIRQLTATVKEIDEELEQDEQVFLRRVRQAGFTEQATYQAAVLSPEVLKQLREEVESYQSMCQRLGDEINFLTKKVTIDKPIDMANLEAKKKMLIEERLLNHQQQTLLLNRQQSDGQILDGLRQSDQKIRQQERDYGLIQQLASVANGQNHQNLTFERYVLATYFEDILAVANQRLSQMTDGRFRLERSEQKVRENSQSGLEIEVFDHYTGKSRHVKSLSGGESFKAALAMALGLAEVIQTTAGGVELETLFIDEGFSGLDEESLQQAVECLVDLNEQGRLIGVISHVTELKERIDTRLNVRLTEEGSRATFSFGR